MIFPDTFYYNAPGSKPEYTSELSGSFSVERLFSGQPAFIKPSLSRVLKPKTLIFTDWTLKFFSPSKKTAVHSILDQLIAEGFIIYTWRMNALSQLSQGGRLPALSPDIDVEEIIEAARLMNISAQQLHLLDDYWIDYLIASEQSDDRRLSLAAAEGIVRDKNAKIESSFNLIDKNASVYLTHLVHDVFSSGHHQFLLQFQLCFPMVNIITNYWSIELSGKMLPNLFALLEGSINDINCHGFKLTAKQLQQIESIEFTTPVEPADFFRLLLQLKGLKAFSVNFLDPETHSLQFILPEMSLASIEEMTFSNHDSGTFNLDMLDQLAVAAPNVQQIRIESYTKTKSFFNFPPNSLLKLKSLQLIAYEASEEDKIDFDALERLLLAAPHITHIDLSYSIIINNRQVFKFPPNSLPHLESINIDDSDINSHTLAALLLAAPNLESIHLRYCSNLSDTLNVPKHSLVHLRQLDLAETSPVILAAFAEAAPNLIYLDLSSCRMDEEPLNLHKNSLAHVEEFNISGANCTFQNLCTLLSATPKLKILDLHFFNEMSRDAEDALENSPLAPNSLLFLEEIRPGAHLSKELIEQLLSAAPNIKRWGDREFCTLTLSDLVNPVEETDLAEESLPQPAHQPEHMLQYIPPAPDSVFKYSGQINHKNQRMLIEQLSQYLTITHEHLENIPTIQKGICKTLALVYLTFKTEKIGKRFLWATIFQPIALWNGREETLTPILHDRFRQLYAWVEAYQFYPLPEDKFFFIATELSELLKTMPIERGVYLNNPWHAIAVYRINESTYEKYDPNEDFPQSFTLKTLVTNIFETCGRLISARLTHEIFFPVIENPNEYLKNGALLSLCKVENIHLVISMLTRSNECFSVEGLNGLLLRNLAGWPAWLSGLLHHRSEIKLFTIELLNQFVKANDDFNIQLMNSLAVALLQPEKWITHVIKIKTWDISDDAWPLLCDFLRDLCYLSHKTTYEQQLTTWKHPDLLINNVDAYCTEMLKAINGDQNRLIECHSSELTDSLCYTLEQYCNSMSRSVFYIDEPKDLICSAASLFRHANHDGEVRPGPGGPLYHFLQTAPRPHVLIVNYDNFQPDEIVSFNSLLDTEPSADRTPLALGTIVIGVLNTNHAHCYQEADFYSRFQLKSQCTLPIESFDLPKPPLSPMADAPQKAVIQLFNAPDWKSRLLGRWIMNGSTFKFQEGLLPQAIKTGHREIEIHNGLWDDPEFKRFWSQIRRGGLWHAGERWSLPAATSIYRHEGYSPSLSDALEWTEALEKEAIILNTATLPDFLGTYQYNEDNTLCFVEGLIARAPHKSVLRIHLTSTLNEDLWAELLTRCDSQGIAIKVYNGLKNNPLFVPWENKNPFFEVIESTDIDTTTALLSEETKDWQVIDVSAYQASDLLQRVDVKFYQEKLGFSFMPKEGALLQALRSKKKIILKGLFSESLVDALAAYLINYERQAEPPQLKIVVTDAKPFSFLSQVSIHLVKPEDKLLLLPHDARMHLQADRLIKEPLATLRARMNFLNVNRAVDVNTAAPWKGMLTLPKEMAFPEIPLDVLRSLEKTLKLMSDRKASVLAMLAVSPYVFLTGCSGVGKTTFVQRVLCADVGSYALFQGEDQIKAWAENQSVHGSLLFLDEANLSHRDWSELEGLFATPPGIVIDSTFYPLTPLHKIVFAGNPISYGHDRNLSNFFKRHGGAVFFEPLSQEMIYETILKPILLEQLPPLIEIKDICQPILDLYLFFCKRSTQDLLISPRDLEMILLLTLVNSQNYPFIPFDYYLNQAIYQIGTSLLPAARPLVIAEFEAQFGSPSTMDFELPSAKIGRFLVTHSRQPLLSQLKERLRLREWRLQPSSLNESQQFAGLGGLIIEGEPGIGKSELMIEVLQAEGYMKQDPLIAGCHALKPFYHMPVTLGFYDKKALLIKAFNEGAVVLVDEINASPMMERVLNSLLMGRHPDTALRPQKPGFLLIGTQNPSNLSGRAATSTALARRMTTLKLPEYTAEEMCEILVDRGILHVDASQMVEVYLERRRYAHVNQLKPGPCFRDLLGLQPIPLPCTLIETPWNRKRKNALMVTFDEDPELSEQKQARHSFGFFDKPSSATEPTNVMPFP